MRLGVVAMGGAVLVVLVVAVAGEAGPDEERREQGEDVGLHEGHEELEHEDGERQRHRDREDPERDGVDQAEQGEDDEVAGHHVGEESNGEGEGLGEEPEDLDRDHDDPEHPVDAGGEVLQVAADALGPDGGVPIIFFDPRG